MTGKLRSISQNSWKKIILTRLDEETRGTPEERFGFKESIVYRASTFKGY